MMVFQNLAAQKTVSESPALTLSNADYVRIAKNPKIKPNYTSTSKSGVGMQGNPLTYSIIAPPKVEYTTPAVSIYQVHRPYIPSSQSTSDIASIASEVAGQIKTLGILPVSIICPVTIENPYHLGENRAISQEFSGQLAPQLRLNGINMPPKVVERHMTFQMLADMVDNRKEDPAYWYSIRFNLVHDAQNELGQPLFSKFGTISDKFIPILKAQSASSLSAALHALGDERVYFPNRLNYPEGKIIEDCYSKLREVSISCEYTLKFDPMSGRITASGTGSGGTKLSASTLEEIYSKISGTQVRIIKPDKSVVVGTFLHAPEEDKGGLVLVDEDGKTISLLKYLSKKDDVVTVRAHNLSGQWYDALALVQTSNSAIKTKPAPDLKTKPRKTKPLAINNIKDLDKSPLWTGYDGPYSKAYMPWSTGTFHYDNQMENDGTNKPYSQIQYIGFLLSDLPKVEPSTILFKTPELDRAMSKISDPRRLSLFLVKDPSIQVSTEALNAMVPQYELICRKLANIGASIWTGWNTSQVSDNWNYEKYLCGIEVLLDKGGKLPSLNLVFITDFGRTDQTPIVLKTTIAAAKRLHEKYGLTISFVGAAPPFEMVIAQSNGELIHLGNVDVEGQIDRCRRIAASTGGGVFALPEAVLGDSQVWELVGGLTGVLNQLPRMDNAQMASAQASGDYHFEDPRILEWLQSSGRLDPKLNSKLTLQAAREQITDFNFLRAPEFNEIDAILNSPGNQKVVLSFLDNIGGSPSPQSSRGIQTAYVLAGSLCVSYDDAPKIFGIQYVAGGKLVQSPAQIWKSRQMDCDESCLFYGESVKHVAPGASNFYYFAIHSPGKSGHMFMTFELDGKRFLVDLTGGDIPIKEIRLGISDDELAKQYANFYGGKIPSIERIEGIEYKAHCIMMGYMPRPPN